MVTGQTEKPYKPQARSIFPFTKVFFFWLPILKTYSHIPEQLCSFILKVESAMSTSLCPMVLSGGSHNESVATDKT